MRLDDDSRKCHGQSPPGKAEITTAESTDTQHGLSLAYSPGVAAPCLDIVEGEDVAYEYTTKGNLVGVVSNDSVVLGPGGIEAQTSKPTIEGKSVLSKRFVGIDVFGVELDIADVDNFVAATKAMEPTSGGISLEDIKASECFEIERQFRGQTDISAFHDDQRGTTIVSGAALLNVTDIVDKDPDEFDTVLSGTGASALATAWFYVSFGAKRENIMMCDSPGIITESHVEDDNVDRYKVEFAKPVDEGLLSDVIEDVDVLTGLSVGGIVSQEMMRSMTDGPVIFAMADPDLEIAYEDTKDAHDDTVIMATGRSDYPNQVDDVPGLPFIFRGALDVHTTEINEAMKRTAAEALAELARQDVPDAVVKAYGNHPLQFGVDYVIPKPLDPCVLLEVTPAVAQAAMTSGAARECLDMNAYRGELKARLERFREMIRVALDKAKSNLKRVALAKGEDERMIHAVYQIQEEGIAKPIPVGETTTVLRKAKELGLGFDPTTADPYDGEWDHYVDRLYELRQWKGVMDSEVEELIHCDSNYFVSVMAKVNGADAMLMGLTRHYSSAFRPPLQIVGTTNDADRVVGVYMMTFKSRVVFCADTTVGLDPNEGVLAETTKHTTDLACQLNAKPRTAPLSYSNFSSVTNEGTRRPRDTAALLQGGPEADFPVGDEMQTDIVLVGDILKGTYDSAELDGPADVLTFPNLEAGSTGYKLLQRLGGAEAIGPMLVGMGKLVHALQRGDEVKNIISLAVTAVADTQKE